MSCNEYLHNVEHNEIKMDISMKKLQRLEYGNKYYSLKGVKTDINNNKSRLYKINQNYLIESDSFLFGDYNSIYFTNSFDNIFLKMHDYPQKKLQKANLIFNDFQSSSFNFFPQLNLDFIEKEGARLSKIYTVSKNLDLTPIYIDRLNYKNLDNINDIEVYSETIKNFIRILESKKYPVEEDAIQLIHNPLNNKYTLYPDLSKFGEGKSIIDTNLLLSKLNVYENPDERSQELNIYNDTLIDKDLVISNSKLNIFNNPKIILDNATIYLNNVEVNFNGSFEKIKIVGLKNSSLYFNSCSNIKIENCIFENLSNISNDNLSLPGAITFYNSNVNIFNSEFRNNIIGDDYINFYHSNFNVSNSTFFNVLSDAVDSDFSNGIIKNNKFLKIGNDALDFSGSKVEIRNNYFEIVGDKAISGGEKSQILVSDNILKNCEIGIVSKDASEVVSLSNQFYDNRLDYTVFQKKTFYLKPSLLTDNKLNSLKYLIEEKSIITSEDTDELVFELNVQDLLYGKIYGKASK